VEIRVDVAHPAVERFLRVYALFELLALLEQRLGLFLILPEIRIADFFFESCQLFAGGSGVKDSSARDRCASSGRCNAAAGLQYVQPFYLPRILE
jgi:hypothetical protein